jgi:hypothetical protein
MAVHEVARSMPAAPDQVFDVAADPQKMPRWLPVLVGEDAVRTDGLRVVADARRLELGERGGVRGWLEVRPEPSGGSDVVLHAETEGDDEGIRAELAGALLRLSNEVAGSSG